MKNAFLSIDIGTSNIYAILWRYVKNQLQILYNLSRPAVGLRRGSIIDLNEITTAVSSLISEIETNNDLGISQVIASFGSTHLYSRVSKGMVVVSRADGVVSEDDISRAIKTAEASAPSNNCLSILTIPRSFKLDGLTVTNNPLGMKGVKLEAECLIIDAFLPDYRNLEKCLESADLKTKMIIPKSLASSRAVLTKKDREVGVVAIDLGAGTTSYSVFEEDNLLVTGVLPVGGINITNDLAVCLTIDTQIAEKIKLDYGLALANKAGKKEIIDFEQYGLTDLDKVTRKHVAEIIQARLEDIFSNINNELKQINRFVKLPGGAVLSGAGSKMPYLKELARQELKLPVRIGSCEMEGLAVKDDPAFMTAIGLILSYLDHEDKSKLMGDEFSDKIKRFFKNFLP